MNEGKFLTRLCLEHIGGVRHRVCHPLVFEAKDGHTFVVPAGFVTDGASVPRLMWALYPPFGDDYEPAAVLHDYLYAHAEAFEGLTRRDADDIFLEAMTAAGFRASGRRAIYWAVRVGGWKPWRRYRQDASEQAAA
jgi:hypothetical protein